MSRSISKNHTARLQKLAIYNRILFASFIVCSIAYLIGVNDLSIKNYMLLDERRRAKNVRTEINQLEVKVMSKGSLINNTPRINDLQMVKVDQIKYINVNPAVAMK
ncbi:hypothetical protein HGA64_01790 [Candidatus Falkowbacteria bacterium]|nr:hypothetical protein [Candidatus Falkowbacteria bacterium]